MNWLPPRHDTDSEHFTAEAFVQYQLASRGITAESLDIRGTVLLAFQPYIYTHLVMLTAGVESRDWSRINRLPLAHGSVGGLPLSIALLPVGAPAAVMYLETLIAGGARTLIAVGAAGSLTDTATIGAAVLPTSAIREEGTSYHYAPAEIAALPDATCVAALRAACAQAALRPTEGPVWTTDAPFRELTSKVARFAADGVVAVDMEASALFIVGMVRGVRVASLFVVSDELFHPWVPAFFDRAYRTAASRIAACAVEAARSIAHADRASTPG